MRGSHFPEIDLARIRRWCADQSATLPADELRIACTVGTRAVDVGEERSPWDGCAADEWTFMAVARLTYIKSRNKWLLGVSDAHGNFHRYTRMPTETLMALLNEIDTAPECAFWG